MSRRALALLLIPAAWLAVFLLVPAAVLTVRSLGPEAARTFAEATTWRLLGRSFLIAGVSTALCLGVSYPAALFIAGCRPRWRNALLFLVVLPFWTNLLVRTYALMFVLRPAGVLYTEGAVVFGLVHSFLPFMILPLYVSIEKVPPRLLEAAQDLGASPWGAFWKVTVPLTMPGIAAGCLLVFIPLVGVFALPEFIGGTAVPMVGSQINHCFVRSDNPGAGSALTLVLMLFTAVLTGLYYRLRRTEGLV
jgi:spermidine/putrescine transport system permease protein